VTGTGNSLSQNWLSNSTHTHTHTEIYVCMYVWCQNLHCYDVIQELDCYLLDYNGYIVFSENHEEVLY